MEKYGTLQIRINLTKVSGNSVRFDGPVLVYDQEGSGKEHKIGLTKNPLGHRINGGREDVLRQVVNAIVATGKYTLVE